MIAKIYSYCCGLFLLASFFYVEGRAYILPSTVIVQKTCENNGSGVYQIEQEVVFSGSIEPLILKETWWVENDNSMRLTVQGTKEYKDKIKMNFLYSGGKRWTNQSVGGKEVSKLDENFIERYFHIRNSQKYLETMIQMKVLPPGVMNKKQVRNLKELQFITEPYVRLSRVGGVISYAFGNPGHNNQEEMLPAFWIAQDYFVLSKVRLPSLAELTADNYIQYSKNLRFPKIRSLKWDNHQITINTLSVSSKNNFNYQGANGIIDQKNKVEGIDNPALKEIVLDFYKRFR